MKLIKKLIFTLTLVTIVLYSLGTFSFVNAIDEPTIYSSNVLLMESKTGKVIYQKQGHEKAYPASTTKVLTAILALEHCDLSEKATASYEAVYSIPWDFTNANIQVGEELTINELLHVLLIASANEAANIIAEHIAGTTDSFAAMMNAKAAEIGCENTHFVNAYGKQDENHYTTAYDLALITRYAMNNDIFRSIVCKTTYTLPGTDKHPERDRVFKNTNELLHKGDEENPNQYYVEECNGVKTGYTQAAGGCIVVSGEKKDVEYIAVVLGARDEEGISSVRAQDAKTLLNYAFDNYYLKTLHNSNDVIKSIPIKKATWATKNLDTIAENEITVVLRKDASLDNIIPNIEIDNDLEAPIPANTKVGTITYTIDGNEYTSNLLAANDVAEFNFFSTFTMFLVLVFVLYVLYKLLKPNKRKKSKKRKKSNKKNNNYMYW